jgi:hypothetical protein
MYRDTILLLSVAALASAQPSISSLSPDATTAGAPAKALTVRGTGFLTGATVRFRTRSLPAAVLSETLLIAQIPADLLGFAGSFEIQVENPSLQGASNPFPFLIRPAMVFITAANLTPAAAGRLYLQALNVSGGSPPYRFELALGALPPGLSLDAASGGLAGYPSQEGSHRLMIRVTDSAGATALREFSLTVTRPVQFVTATIPSATAGSNYSASLEALGGVSPYTWRLSSGVLPPGVTLSPAGLLAGLPSAAGSFPFGVEVRDSTGTTATGWLTLTVLARMSILSLAELQQPVVGTAYSQRLAATGGVAPYTWRISGGGLPPGLALDQASGTIQGSASAAGLYRFLVEARDATGQSASIEMTLSVSARLTVATNPSLPQAMVGSLYNASIAAAGGTPPYSWTLASGALPPGLTLDGRAGLLRGTSMTAGLFAFRLEVADSAGARQAQAFQLTVALPAAPKLTLAAPAAAASGQQHRIEAAIAEPYPAEIAGTLNLQFKPDAAGPADDPAIQFSAGGRRTGFRIAAGARQAVFDQPVLALQTGTVAGSVEVSVELTAQGLKLQPQPSPVTLPLASQPPVLDSVEARRTQGGLEVVIKGFSNTRELGGAVFRFQPAAGADLRTAEISVPLAGVAGQWFSGQESRQFGGMFLYRQVFTIVGDSAAPAGISVRLSNHSGESREQIASFN